MANFAESFDYSNGFLFDTDGSVLFQLKPDLAPAAYQLALLSEQFDRPRAIQRWRKYVELADGKPSEHTWLTVAAEHLKRLQQP